MKRLTKAEIAQGMKTVPIETIILGAQGKQGIKLTKKQKEFAEQVVATGNKTEAYRRSYNVDSIQATIPGGVTVTGVYVTASFYADPWTAATMSQGVMYFSGPCGSS